MTLQTFSDATTGGYRAGGGRQEGRKEKPPVLSTAVALLWTGSRRS